MNYKQGEDSIEVQLAERLVEYPGYYAVIPSEVRYCKELTCQAKLLYGEITALAKKHGFCWASNSYFANLYGVGAPTVSGWITSLARLGFIKVEVFQHYGNARKIWLMDSFEKSKEGSFEKTGEGHSKNRNTYIEKKTVNSTREEKSLSKRKPKDLETLIAYAKSRDISEEDAQAFFDSQEAGGWTRGGKPLHDWQASLRTWKANGWLASQKRNAGSSSRPLSAYEIKARVKEIIAQRNQIYNAYPEGKIPPDDRRRMNELAKRRDELEAQLTE